MLNLFSYTKYTSFSLFFLVLFVLNFHNWQNPYFGAILLITFFAYYGAALGRTIVQKETWLHRSWAGSLLLLSIFMLLGTLNYYIGPIIPDLWVLYIVLAPSVIYLFSRKHGHQHDTLHDAHHHPPTAILGAITLGIVFLVIAFTIISQVEILDSVRSVWEQVPLIIFVPVTGFCLILVSLLLRGRERAWLLPMIMAWLFLFVSLVLIVYPLGYGFDTFIHQTTVEHIAENGTITPKPFYYIGQYSAILFVHQAFHLPIDLVDRFLLPLLTALLLPLAWYFFFYHLTENRRATIFSTIGIFLIPLSGLIVTTPQGLANLWTMLIILLSIPLLKNQREVSLVALFVLGLTVLAIHPLAGIPIMLYLALIATGPFAERSPYPPVARFLFSLIVVAGSIVLPIAFLISSKLSGLSISFNWSSLSPKQIFHNLNLEVFFSNRFDVILDFVYLYGFNTSLILVILSAIAIIIFYRDLSRPLFLPLVMIGMLLINYLVLKTVVDFSFLIDYERSNYADRLIPLASFFLIPYLGLFWLWLWQKLLHKPVAIRAFAICLIACILSSAFYLTYPRKDNYVTSHGFNVSQSDLEVVKEIDKLGGENDYLVLANQSVSAAAISTFGFKQYYNDIFYYHVPTGGQLYEYFLEMNDSHDQQTAESAMSLVNTDKLYYVVNEYWWQAPRIIENAKRTADSWSIVNSGKIYLFEYNVNSTNSNN